MPTNKIKKDAREGKGSKKTLEKKWNEAKKSAEKSGQKDNYPYIMSIYKKMTHQASIISESALRSIRKGYLTATGSLARIEANSLEDYLGLNATAIHADAFEGWINTLGYSYDRPSGADYVILDSRIDNIVGKLKDQDWEFVGDTDEEPLHFEKGTHAITLESEGSGTKLTTDSVN